MSAAHALVDYFDALGVSHLYLSPILRTESGAFDGYAVVDFDDIDPRIGTVQSLSELSEELRGRGMGLILDFVPNHMSASPEENPWWRDVLEMGPRSRFGRFFDIDWASPDPELQGRVLAPVLSQPYAAALKRGMALERTLDGLFVRAGEPRYPLSPATWSEALGPALGEDPELRGLLTALDVYLDGLPKEVPMSHSQWSEKERLKEAVLAHLTLSTELGAAADRGLEATSGDERASRALLDRQAYLLAPWWEAASRINYRTFFDVKELAALRVEDPEAFEMTHRFVLALVRQGWLQGLRIDHVDGMLDPKGYLDALPPDLYVVVEKLLERHERLRPGWRCEGTTGYDALHQLERLFVSPEGEARLVALHRELTSSDRSFEDVAYESRKEILSATFQGELRLLARRLTPLVREFPGRSACALEEVVAALGDIVSCFGVHRTYLRPSENEMDDWDRRVLESAASAARRRRGDGDAVVDAIASVLSGREPAELSDEARNERRQVALRFQQLTSAVRVKGVEDTAFYRHFPLLSTNEVGGAPADMTLALEEFHQRNRERVALWPRGLNTTSTHDTHRDEDVRARIDVLSELAEPWASAVRRWISWNQRHKRALPTGEAPDPSEEYLLYQTLVGSWPLEPLDAASHRDYVERVQGFMRKALREAKRHTSWTDPDSTYESAVAAFVEKALDPEESFRFLDDFARFERGIRSAGLLNALSRTLLKATMPGVPDFYQGSELFRLALVAPDNRAPVDFENCRVKMRHVVEEVEREGAEAFLESALGELEDGRLKLYVTRVLLHARRRLRELFDEGSYDALGAEGPAAEHVIAFARECSGQRVLCAAGRFFTRLSWPPVGEAAWRDTVLGGNEEAGRVYRELLSGRVLRCGDRGLLAADVFRHAPFGVLVSTRRSSTEEEER